LDVCAQPFIDWDWDGRIQKIGPYYRVFKRVSMNWKGNVGNMSMIEVRHLVPPHGAERAPLLTPDLCFVPFTPGH
jgi:hypothetical protein